VLLIWFVLWGARQFDIRNGAQGLSFLMQILGLFFAALKSLEGSVRKTISTPP